MLDNDNNNVHTIHEPDSANAKECAIPKRHNLLTNKDENSPQTYSHQSIHYQTYIPYSALLLGMAVLSCVSAAGVFSPGIAWRQGSGLEQLQKVRLQRSSLKKVRLQRNSLKRPRKSCWLERQGNLREQKNLLL